MYEVVVNALCTIVAFYTGFACGVLTTKAFAKFFAGKVQESEPPKHQPQPPPDTEYHGIIKPPLQWDD